jgi:hypothetical protein
MKIHSLFFSIILILLLQQSFSQQLELLDIEPLEEVPGLTIPEACTPEDWIIIINSANPDLRFESNILPDTAFKIVHIANQYLICHERSRFILTVSGGSLRSEDIRLFDLNKIYAFNITSNIQRGTINVRTSPPNTSIFFPALNEHQSSTSPITKNTGNYPITIKKDRFQSIDTIVRFNRDTSNYFFSLKPLFAQIRLDLTTEDSAALKNAPQMVIHDIDRNTDYIVDLNYLVDKEARADADYYDGVRYFQLYQNNIIPLPEGNYRINIEAEKYRPFERVLFAEKGTITNLPVSLNLIYGYFSFIDSLGATGAKIFVNDQFTGDTVPTFRTRTPIGRNKVSFEKPGYKTQHKEYFLNVAEDVNTAFYVAMKPFQELTIVSEPPSAVVKLENNMIGITPLTYEFPLGNYDLILEMPRYSSHLHKLTESPDFKLIDTLRIVLFENHSLKIKSEGKEQKFQLRGLDCLENIIIENPNQMKRNRETEELRLPFGRYLVETNMNDYVTYKGIYYHHPNKRLRIIPSYSKSSFTFLTADYISEKSIEASLGRFHIFPKSGLSTSLFNIQYSVFDYTDHADSINSYETLTFYPFFLNWDWRLGGSIIRQFDICLLTRAKWSPGLKIADNLNLFDYNDGNMFTYFYGIELSSRLPAFNLNLKVGQQVMNGEIYVWDKQEKEYSELETPVKISENNFVVSLGVTIGFTGVSKSNNMLRLWRKPLVHRGLDMFNK